MSFDVLYPVQGPPSRDEAIKAFLTSQGMPPDLADWLLTRTDEVDFDAFARAIGWVPAPPGVDQAVRARAGRARPGVVPRRGRRIVWREVP